ncbi:MAG TPA: cation diffusion facilitator family transporter [Acetobacteraceae bacterium]|nr:cation diffusion facilitator family transporter [Acetobacteraceae bacterium]
MTRAERIATGSIGIGCLVLALKGAAWWVSGSAAFYSDALESTVNVAASAIALFAIRLAAKPADAEHPYGHDKAEFFAAVIEGVLIVIAALSIFREAWRGVSAPHALTLSAAAFCLSLAATGLNAFWSIELRRAGRRLRSAALVADARHLMSDVVTSLGIVAGVALVLGTGERLIDPALAAAAGIYVLWSGVSTVSGSLGGLMDAAPDPAVVARIRELVSNAATGAIEAHDLRSRHAGRLTFLEFHLVVPGSMTVAESHAICDRIEAALKSEMEYLVITIHVEPEAKAKQHGVPVL